MALKVTCPTCGKSYKMPDSVIEKLAACNGCGGRFYVQETAVRLESADELKPSKAKPESVPLADVNPMFVAAGAVAALLILIIGVSWLNSDGGNAPAENPSDSYIAPSYTSPVAESSPYTPPARTDSPIYSEQIRRSGQVDYSMIATFKKSWQEEGWRYKPRTEQAKATALMVAVVRNDISGPADREATLDYIQSNIESW